MRVVKIEAAECRVPLPREVKLGSVRLKTRDYVVLRLTSDDGSVGEAIGYVRNTPVLSSLEIIGRSLLGTEIDGGTTFVDSFLRANVNGRLMFHRAVSLIDIALTDLRSRQMAVPFHASLGGRRKKLPTMAVAGYYLAERSPDDIEREVRSYFDDGVSIVKLMIDGSNQHFDLDLIGRLASIKPGCLAIDAHWSWQDVGIAREYLAPFDDLRLRFIEDPFGVHDVELTADLQLSLRTDLAAGEDVPEAKTLARLARNLRIIRLDATTSGGLTGACAVLKSIESGRHEVLPHVFPHLHSHLAAAFNSIEAVEFVSTEIGADPLDRLLARPLRFEHGELLVDEEPGAGTELRWSAVESFRQKHFVLESNS